MTIHQMKEKYGNVRPRYNHKRDEEYEKVVVEVFELCSSTRLVADILGVGIQSVRKVLHRHNIDTPKAGARRKAYTRCDERHEDVMRMYHEGCSLAHIAREVGTKGAEVKKFLQRQGIDKDDWSWKVEGERHGNWKGGRIIDKHGYVMILDKHHPHSRKHTGYIYEHRLQMEKFLGRLLEPHEVVHHIDGDKQNNAIENLQLYQSNADHLRDELTGRVPNWSEDGKERIRKAVSQPRKQKGESNPPE